MNLNAIPSLNHGITLPYKPTMTNDQKQKKTNPSQKKDGWDWTSMGSTFSLDKPVQFGVATWSENMFSGIMGVAYGRGYNQNYSGFIDELYDQGLIADKDFSIALGSVDEDNGLSLSYPSKN